MKVNFVKNMLLIMELGSRLGMVSNEGLLYIDLFCFANKVAMSKKEMNRFILSFNDLQLVCSDRRLSWNGRTTMHHPRRVLSMLYLNQR